MADTTFGALQEAAKEAGYGPEELITPSTYDAEVVATNTKLSSKGKRQWGVKFKLVGGPHDGAGVWNNMYVSPESPTALAILLRDLDNLGAGDISKADYMNDEHAQAIADRMLGAKVRIKVINEVYNGDDQNKVKGIFPPSGGAQTARTADATPAPAARAEAPRSPF